MPNFADLQQADALARQLAKDLPDSCRPDFLRLTRALLHGPRFQWLLAEAHSDVLRDRLLLALDQVLRKAGLHSSRLPLDRSIADVPALEAALARHAKGCAVVHVLGRRGWFDAARWDAFNVRRERLVSHAPARLLFWLDAEAIEAAANGAPDLWAWRAGVYGFSESIPIVVRTLGDVSSGPPASLVSLVDSRSAAERRQRVAEIQAWLQGSPSLADEELVGPVDELGRLLYSLGEFDAALQHWQSVELPLHLRRNDEWAHALTKGQIADVLRVRGQFDEALRIRQKEQLPVFERLGSVRSVAVTKGKIADVLQARGQFDEALRIRREELLPVFERLGDVREAAVTKGRIADVFQARGQLDEALRIRQDEELPIYERLGDVREGAVAKGKIADVLQARGQLGEALRIRQEELLPVFERLGDVRGVAITKGKIAQQQFDAGERELAAQLFREALAPLERMGLPEAGQLRQMMAQRGIHP